MIHYKPSFFQVLRAANLLNKTWPVRISCRRYFPGAAGAKILHFIRHGQGLLVERGVVQDCGGSYDRVSLGLKTVPRNETGQSITQKNVLEIASI